MATIITGNKLRQSNSSSKKLLREINDCLRIEKLRRQSRKSHFLEDKFDLPGFGRAF